MYFNLEQLKFMAILRGDEVLDFGFINNRKEFFDWLLNNSIINNKRLKNSYMNENDFYVYYVLKDFRFADDQFPPVGEYSWHNVGKGGNILLNLNYLIIEYTSIK